MNYYVYTYRDPISSLPFYVGKGSKNRASFHLKLISSNIHKNKYFQNTYKKVKHETGLDPLIVIEADGLEEQAAYDLEAKLIKQYGRKLFDPGGILCNLTEGGIGPKGYRHTAEDIERMRLSKQNITDSTRQKLSRVRLGKKDSPETVEKRAAKTRGKTKPSHNMRQPKSDSHKLAIKLAQSGEKCPRSKTWRLISPDNEEFIVKSLKTFCESRNLPVSAFHTSAHNSNKPVSKGAAKGWQAFLLD